MFWKINFSILEEKEINILVFFFMIYNVISGKDKSGNMAFPYFTDFRSHVKRQVFLFPMAFLCCFITKMLISIPFPLQNYIC